MTYVARDVANSAQSRTKARLRAFRDRTAQLLYAAPVGLEAWSSALDALSEDLDAATCHLAILDRFGRLESWQRNSRGGSEYMLEYVRHFHLIDPTLELARASENGAVIAASSCLTEANRDRFREVQEYWRSYRLQAPLTAKIAEDERALVICSMMRPAGDIDFGASDLTLVARYMSHLANAYKIAGHVNRTVTTGSIGESLLQSSGRPMLLLDPHDAVVVRNSEAAAMIESGEPFTLSGKRLACSNDANQRLLQKALGTIRGRFQSGGMAQPRHAFHVLDRTGQRTHCTLLHFAPEQSMGAFGRQCMVLLSIVRPRNGAAADPALLESMFDLSPAEARVANAIALGEDVGTIARRLRVSLNTVRTQLKTVFLKTDTHRQAELVALLHQVGSA